MKHYGKNILIGLALGMAACSSLKAAGQDSGTATSPAENASKPAPLNDHIPFPLPAFSKSSPAGSGLLFQANGQPSQLSPLARLAPSEIEISAMKAETELKGLTALRLSVKNNTDRPVAFNADESSAIIGDLHLPAAALSDLSDRIAQPDNPRNFLRRSVENTVTSAVTLGALGAVKGELIRKGPIADRYGFDNALRSDRLGRFAERILWPGDTSEGLVYFKTNKSLAGALIQVPVHDFYDKTDNTTVPVTIK